MMYLVLMLMLIDRIVDIKSILTITVINTNWISSFVINYNEYYEAYPKRKLFLP